MSAPSDVGAVEELGRDLSRLLGDGALPPEAEEALRSLIALSRRLASDKAGMAATIAAQEGQIAALAAQAAALTAQIAQLQRDLYGSRSERRGDGADGSDDDEGADGKDGRGGGRPGRRKERGDAVNDTGLRFNGQAPVIDIAVTPPEIEGLSVDDYEVVSERVHCRLAALECRHVVIRYRHVTVKIRETGALAGAPAREGVFKNNCADVSFVAALLIDKFLWHLPLYRQHRMLAAAGIAVNRGSLSLWANRAIALLKPIHDAQWRSVLQSAVIQMDETPIRAGRHPGKPGSMKKGYFWPVLGDRGEVVFPFAGSRRHRHAAEFLGDYAGTLVSDGYGAYEAYVAARNGAVRHQGCWIHTRRNFWEQKDDHPAMAGEALALIGALYTIEEEIDGRPPAARLIARRTRSRAAVDGFWDWCGRTLEEEALTPKHPIRKAIRYAVERRATLEVFLDDPDVPPDTNRIENKLRPAKLGQRNWLFAWTELGAENIGIVNGLLATCRMQGVDPRIWLTDVLLRIDTHPASRVDELTPRRWKTLFADDPLTSDVAAATAGAASRRRKRGGVALAVAPDGDVDPLQKRRKLGPRQRQRLPTRRPGRREQALLQALGPDEEPAMLEAENLHHRPPAVDEHVPAPAGGVLPEMARDQRAQPVEAAAQIRRFRRQPDAARRPDLHKTAGLAATLAAGLASGETEPAAPALKRLPRHPPGPRRSSPASRPSARNPPSGPATPPRPETSGRYGRQPPPKHRPP